MELKSLALTNFRNHQDLKLSFEPGINFLCGANARGKTNALEAIYYFATTKSFRTSKDNLVVKDNCPTATASAVVERNFGSVNLAMEIDRVNKKSFWVNGEKMHSPSKVLGNFCAVLFSPDEMKIAKGGPEDRRNFLDSAICELSGAYYDLLLRFDKVLVRRNLLLKRNASDAEIEVWDDQFASLAAKIIHQRNVFVKKLTPYAASNMKFLSGGKEELVIKYDSPFKSADPKQEIMDQLGANRLKDRELGYTSIGPHRDDLVLLASGTDLKTHGSQGQQRTAVLALKLAVYEVFKETISESPVLLLDDVFSELDSTRAKLLFEKVKSGQTIITGTRARASSFSYNKIKI